VRFDTASVAETWMESTLLPMALSAAGHPPQPHPATICEQTREQAGAWIDDRSLLGAAVIARDLARSPRADQLFERIERTLLNDAIELAIARDLAFDVTLDGVDDANVRAREEAAGRCWKRWEATDGRVQQELVAFVRACLGRTDA
jgi:hypothetical protein